MTRCVAIHANGQSEVLDVPPARHQELRGLGYRRFVVRSADGRALTTAVYARGTPSGWQFADAAKKLWGRGEYAVQVFDERGEQVADTLPVSATPLPMERTIAQTPKIDGQPTPIAAIPAVDPSAAKRAPLRVEPAQVPELIARANELLPDTDPRKITAHMLEDLRRAAHEARLNSGDWLYGEGDINERKAFVDRLDAHIRALSSYLTRS